jgi:cyanophycinase
MNRRALLLVSSFILLAISMWFPVSAEEPVQKLLMPIGGGYSDIYAGFSAAAVAHSRDGLVKILVLPVAYATNPEKITEAERKDNLQAAENRRYEIEEACKRAAPESITCQAVLAPIFTRSDAVDLENLAFFESQYSAAFILGGDQTVAMRVLQGTPFEAALASAYAEGMVVAGTSAGGALQAETMLGGYNKNYSDGSSLNFGSADVWIPPERRGLPFGLQNAILDQHFYQRSRLGRLLEAISLPDVPHVGVGIDAYTGVSAPEGNRLEGVFGLYTVTILDAQSLHAAQGVRYSGPQNTLSLRNVLVHLLAPGDFSYDLVERRHSLAPVPEQIERDFSSLKLPEGAGTLLLAGGMSDISPENPTIQRFNELTGAAQGKILVIASGYPTESSAQRAADKYKDALSTPAETLVIPKEETTALSLPEGLVGIVLVGRDQSLIRPELLGALRTAWAGGVPLLADDAGTAILGTLYSAHEPTPREGEEVETAVQKSFYQGRTNLVEGLGLLPIALEPRLITDNRWGRFFSLAYAAPQTIVLGLCEDAVIEINPQGAHVIGLAPVLSLDLSQAQLDLGENQAFVIANGLLDVYAPGDLLQPEQATTNSRPEPQPTPNLASVTPTPPPSLQPSTTPASDSPLPTQTAQATEQVLASRAPVGMGSTPSPVVVNSIDQDSPVAPEFLFILVLGMSVLALAVWAFMRRRVGR